MAGKWGCLLQKRLWNSPATRVQHVRVHGATGREYEQLGALLCSCAWPGRASLGLLVQMGQHSAGTQAKILNLEFSITYTAPVTWDV